MAPPVPKLPPRRGTRQPEWVPPESGGAVGSLGLDGTEGDPEEEKLEALIVAELGALKAPEALVEDEALKEDEPSCSVGNLFSPWRRDPPSWDGGPHPRTENQPAVDAAEAAGGGDSAGPAPKRARGGRPSGPFAFRVRCLERGDSPPGVTWFAEWARVEKEIEWRRARRRELLDLALNLITEVDRILADDDTCKQERYDKLQALHGRLAAIYARVSAIDRELEGL